LFILLTTLSFYSKSQTPVRNIDTIVYKSGAKVACRYESHTKNHVIFQAVGEFPSSKSDIKEISHVVFALNKEAQNQINSYAGSELIDDDNLWKAGRYLKKSSALWYSGMLISILGGGLSIVGAATRNTPVSVVGIGFGSVGFAIGMASFAQIGKAGRHLQNYKAK
jgi:hypothetical protein